MSIEIRSEAQPDVDYPDCDGQPMSDNTLQFEWITTIKNNLEALYRDRPDVFVAGDLLWYPVEGSNTIRTAPDAMVAIGRPKGYRGSYMQWREEGIAPQVVFEILSPGNRQAEMIRKFQFYEKYGVQEYYSYDPDHGIAEGWIRRGDKLEEIPEIHGWTSPCLGIRFEVSRGELKLFRPDGQGFLTFVELERLRELVEARAEEERLRAEEERLRAEKERRLKERLIEQLRALGVEPDLRSTNG